MQQALEALEVATTPLAKDRQEVLRAQAALRERLAQPDAYGYASRLAVAIWEQHYKDVAPQWKPLDDLLGVLTQIDNMTSGLTRLAQPEQEPVAWIDEFGNVFPLGAQRGPKHLNEPMKPLYTTPPQRQWQWLTEEEIERACVPLGAAMLSFTEVARAIEAKLKEKNT